MHVMEEIGISRLHYLLVNVIVFIAAIIGTLVMHLRSGYTIFRMGFFCSDDSISHPLKEDTVPTLHLLLGCFSFSIFTIICCELIGFLVVWRRVDNSPKAQEMEETVEEKERRNPWKLLLCRITTMFVMLGYGFVLVVFLTDFVKMTAGRLRPDFLATCQPKPGSYNCSEGYVSTYTCLQEDQGQIEEARKSFPSGHASISWYHMMFTIMLIQDRMSTRHWPILKPFIQVLAALTATFVSVSRITDYKHFANDVVAGALLGSGFGYLFAKQVKNLILYKGKVSGDTNLQEIRTS